jgi:hypothetical protein
VDLIPRLAVGIDERLVKLDRGIVDETVDARQRAQHAFNRGSVGDVELDRAGAIGGEAVSADHIPPDLGQVLAYRRANPTQSAGYDDGTHGVIVGARRVSDATEWTHIQAGALWH